MATITKNQHYVPQLLLRKFASQQGNDYRVNVYDIKREQYRPNQSIKNVCSGNYTYDRDNSFEGFLSKEIESPAVEPIDLIVSNPHGIFKRPNEHLLRFLITQAARTRQAYDGTLDSINSTMQTIFQETARLNGVSQNGFERVRIEPENPSVILSYMAALSAFHYRLISDLSVAIIINNTNQEFILSDHPVFQYNWYLRGQPSVLQTSYSAIGCQFFLPLSPSITYCLYDASIYLYKAHSQSGVIVATEEDVTTLNSFQALNASESLIARSERMADFLVGIGQKYANSKPFISFANNSEASIREDGSLRSTHLTWREQAYVASMPSFVRIKNKIRRRKIINCHRCPYAVKAHEAALAILRSR